MFALFIVMAPRIMLLMPFLVCLFLNPEEPLLVEQAQERFH
jgi:hypothetical protein